MTGFRRVRSPKHEWSDPQLRSASTNRPMRSIQSKGRPQTVHRHQSAPLPPIIYLNTADRATRSAPDRKENRLKNRRPQGKLPPSLSQRRYIQSTPYRGSSSTQRRGARVAESGSLENCCPGNGTVGSIPTLSAKPNSHVPLASMLRPADKTLTEDRWINPSYAFQLRLFLQGTSKFDHR